MKKISVIILTVGLILIIFGIVLNINSNSVEVTYVVSFDTGIDEKIKQQTVMENESLKDIGNIEKDGYTFVGWYLNGKKFNLKTKINASIVLVAKWLINDETEIGESKVDSDQIITEEEANNNQLINDSSSNTNGSNNTDDSNDISTSNDSYVKATDINFNASTITVEATKAFRLAYTLTPQASSLIDAVWNSNNIEVATVSADGLVTGFKEGTTVISVSIDGNLVASVTVNVVRKITTEYSQDKLHIIDTEGILYSGKVTLKYDNGNTVTVTVPKEGATLDSENYTVIEIKID